METRIEKISPESAQEILRTQNTHNRSLRAWKVQAHARDMREGRWLFTGEPIKFDPDGVLLDGQHRLAAVVESGVAQEFLVVYGLESEAQHVMDTGSVRSAGDQLHLAGVQTDSRTARDMGAIARVILSVFMEIQKPTTAEVFDLVNSHRERFEISAKRANQLRMAGLRGGAALWGAAFYTFDSLDPTASCEFFNRMHSGAGLEADDPILHLRNRHLRGDVRIGTNPAAHKANLAWIFKAWNMFRSGQRVNMLFVFKHATETYPIPR